MHDSVVAETTNRGRNEMTNETKGIVTTVTGIHTEDTAESAIAEIIALHAIDNHIAVDLADLIAASGIMATESYETMTIDGNVVILPNDSDLADFSIDMGNGEIAHCISITNL